MPRLIVVANRLPVKMTKTRGGLELTPSAGGLATGLSTLPEDFDRIWVGWPGSAKERLNPDNTEELKHKLRDIDCYPVFLSKKHIREYYEGFSNATIWPLFHYFASDTVFEDRFWHTYRHVNELFCKEVLKYANDDDYIWVHDYHLLLLPKLLRQHLPKATIGYFLHIPFPSFELFRLLPWREELLEGILGADLIGFHTYDYVRHFLSCSCRLMALEHHLGRLSVDNRMVKVDAFPMGIDYKKYAQANKSNQVKKEIDKMRRTVGDRKIIASIDRLDYTKGIIQRLEAFDLFLSRNPEYKGKVTMILVAVPSRTNVSHYKQLRLQLEQLVGRVNGEHATIGCIPVWYLYKSLSFESITALYNVADVALLTPVRDGMNLIAKEYVAAKDENHGVLILSEMAGASSELGESLIVNANNKYEIVAAIKQALDMPTFEQTLRLKPMQQRLKRYDVKRWANEFMDSLEGLKKSQQSLSLKALTEQAKEQITKDFDSAQKRLFLLDYDGTLVKLHGKPQDAGPDDEIIELLKRLAEIPRNELVIISGRDKKTISDWLGFLDITMIAEHGAWIRWKGRGWKSSVEPVHTNWKDTLRPILELYADRTPGAAVEEKDFALVWHCRRSDPALAAVRAQELRDALVEMTANLQVGVFEGSKIIEVKQHGVSKGKAAELVLKRYSPDFALAAGDDYTDEEMFTALPSDAYTIKVGAGPSEARFYVDSVDKIRTLLTQLSGEQTCSD